MDTMKIAPGVYQYTAIDDCSRWRVLGVYPRRAAKYTPQFLERVVEEMPFPIQRGYIHLWVSRWSSQDRSHRSQGPRLFETVEGRHAAGYPHLP